MNSSRRHRLGGRPESSGPTGLSTQARRMQSASRAAPGALAEGLGEGVAETARRFVAGVPAGVLGALAAADQVERAAQATRAAVGVEGHPVLLLEEAAHPRRLEPAPAELGVVQPRRRVALDLGDRARNPLGRPAVGLERTAAHARPEAGEERRADGRRSTGRSPAAASSPDRTGGRRSRSSRRRAKKTPS